MADGRRESLMSVQVRKERLLHGDVKPPGAGGEFTQRTAK
jgi:hypothetical protein